MLFIRHNNIRGKIHLKLKGLLLNYKGSSLLSDNFVNWINTQDTDCMYNTSTTVKLTEHITCMNSGTTEFTEPSRALTDDINENNLIFLTEGEAGGANENDITLLSEGEWDDNASNVSASNHESLINVTEVSALEPIETIKNLVVTEKDDPRVILSNVRKKNLNKVILVHLNINHLSGNLKT